MRYDGQFNLSIVLQDLTENFFDCRAVSKVFGSIEFDYWLTQKLPQI